MQNILRFLSVLCASNAWAHARHHHQPVYPTTIYPNITITVWNNTNCGSKLPVDLSSGVAFEMIPIAENYADDGGIQSYWLSRDLQTNERLDWSTCAPGACHSEGEIKGECAEFLLETSPDSNCHALLAHTCYLLQPAARVRILPLGGCSRVTYTDLASSASISGTRQCLLIM